MIFHLHTPTVGVLVGSDHIPRIGEKIRVSYPNTKEREGIRDPAEEGLYLVEDVLYEAPNNPGRQRIDVYGRKISDLPADLSYSSWQEATYKAKLKEMSR